MSFEPTSKGNPYKFVINQHFHTAHAIGKFHNDNDKLDVYIIKSGKIEQKQKKSKIFCAKRNCDQKTETTEHSHLKCNIYLAKICCIIVYQLALYLNYIKCCTLSVNVQNTLSRYTYSTLFHNNL